MYLGHLIGCVMIGKVRQHYHLGIVSEYSVNSLTGRDRNKVVTLAMMFLFRLITKRHLIN